MNYTPASPDNESIRESAKSLRKVNESLDRLNATIVESNKKAEDYNEKMRRLTWVGIAVAVMGGIIASQNLGISETQKAITANQLEIQKLEFNKNASLLVSPRAGFEFHRSGESIGFWLRNNGRADVALDLYYWPVLYCDEQRIQGFNESIQPEEQYKKNPQWLRIDEQIFMTSLRGIEYDVNDFVNYQDCYIQVNINALQPPDTQTQYRIKVQK